MAQLHGSFTPAHTDGCGAQCFVGVQCASIFNPAVCHRPQAATLALRSGVVRSPVTVVPSCGLETRSWRTGRMARHKQECIRLPYTAALAPNGLSLSRSYTGTPRGKGENTQRPALGQFRSKPRMEIISFVSSRRRKSSSTWGRGKPSRS